jgi:nitrogen fixation NifU-like protein
MDLFSEILVDHYKHPHHKGHLKKHSVLIHEVNPLCGDKLEISLLLDDKGKIKDIGINPQGCAISTASASMLSDKLIGKSLKEVEKISEKEVFKMLGIEVNPARIKCAMLPVVSIKKALLLAKSRKTK